MAYIAVQGCILETSPGTGVVTVTSVPATDVFVDNKGCYFGQLAFAVSAYSNPTTGIMQGAGAGAIPGTGIHCQNSGQNAVLEGDKVTLVVTGVRGNRTATESVTVTVKSANQTSTDVT